MALDKLASHVEAPKLRSIVTAFWEPKRDRHAERAGAGSPAGHLTALFIGLFLPCSGPLRGWVAPLGSSWRHSVTGGWG